MDLSRHNLTLAELNVIFMFKGVFAVRFETVAIDIRAIDSRMVTDCELAVMGVDRCVLLGNSGVVYRNQIT